VLLNSREVNLLLSRLDSGLKVFLQDSDVNFQASSGTGFFHQFFDNLVISEDGALDGMVYMGKKAMFDWVPLGGIGRVMAN